MDSHKNTTKEQGKKKAIRNYFGKVLEAKDSGERSKAIESLNRKVSSFGYRKLGFGYRQQDTAEFLAPILENLFDQLPLIEQSTFSPSSNPDNYNPKEAKTDSVLIPSLSLEGKNDGAPYKISELLCEHQKEEAINSENAILFQEKGGQSVKIEATKTLKLITRAQEFALQLKRFSFNNRTIVSTKNAEPVDLDEIKLPNQNGDEIAFEARAFIVHLGSISSGHYITYVKEKDAKWYCYNDNSREEVAEEALKEAKKQAYVVKYSDKSLENTTEQIGSENLGNTCWANAALALIGSFEQFQKYKDKNLETEQEKESLESDSDQPINNTEYEYIKYSSLKDAQEKFIKLCKDDKILDKIDDAGTNSLYKYYDDKGEETHYSIENDKVRKLKDIKADSASSESFEDVDLDHLNSVILKLRKTSIPSRKEIIDLCTKSNLKIVFEGGLSCYKLEFRNKSYFIATDVDANNRFIFYESNNAFHDCDHTTEILNELEKKVREISIKEDIYTKGSKFLESHFGSNNTKSLQIRVHGSNHAIRVALLSLDLMEMAKDNSLFYQPSEKEKELIFYAALMHDLGREGNDGDDTSENEKKSAGIFIKAATQIISDEGWDPQDHWIKKANDISKAITDKSRGIIDTTKLIGFSRAIVGSSDSIEIARTRHGIDMGNNSTQSEEEKYKSLIKDPAQFEPMLKLNTLPSKNSGNFNPTFNAFFKTINGDKTQAKTSLLKRYAKTLYDNYTLLDQTKSSGEVGQTDLGSQYLDIVEMANKKKLIAERSEHLLSDSTLNASTNTSKVADASRIKLVDNSEARSSLDPLRPNPYAAVASPVVTPAAEAVAPAPPVAKAAAPPVAKAVAPPAVVTPPVTTHVPSPSIKPAPSKSLKDEVNEAIIELTGAHYKTDTKNIVAKAIEEGLQEEEKKIAPKKAYRGIGIGAQVEMHNGGIALKIESIFESNANRFSLLGTTQGYKMLTHEEAKETLIGGFISKVNGRDINDIAKKHNVTSKEAVNQAFLGEIASIFHGGKNLMFTFINKNGVQTNILCTRNLFVTQDCEEAKDKLGSEFGAQYNFDKHGIEALPNSDNIKNVYEKNSVKTTSAISLKTVANGQISSCSNV